MKHIFAIIALFAGMGIASSKNAVTPCSLTCNDMENPVSVSHVSFSWKLASTVQGAGQTAYEIWMGTTPKCVGNVWKSGKIESEDQLDILPPSGTMLEEGKKYYWKVRVWDGEGKVSAWSPVASFGVSIDNCWDSSEWIATGEDGNGPLPYFRKPVQIKGKAKRAVVYLSGLGCSQLYFNGKAVEPDRILDPAQTDYEKRALYSAFDVTGLLSSNGSNCIGVMLGDGWFNQDDVWGGGMTYGKPRLRCQMVIEYADGKMETVGTDTSWKWFPGPLVKSNVYQGDEYDANLEIEGWSEPLFDDGGWNMAVKATGVVPPRMEAQELPPMRAGEPVEAVAMWRSKKGANVWILDFGKNITSVPRFCASLPKGARLQTRGAEEVDENGEMDYSTTGIEFVGYQQDAYTFAGKGEETWMPVFTYHGMRYVELTVEGTDAKPLKDWIRLVPVGTDVKTIGEFECSDNRINRMHQLAVNTMLNCFVGLPVDCNQREKCGWLGDTHAYDRAANLNFQMNNFWLKYLEDIRTTSDVTLVNTLHHKLYNSEFYFTDKEAGIPFMIAPGKRLCGVASPDWGTAVVQLPWHLYVYYGNRRILEDYYSMMSLWTRHIADTAIDDIVYQGLGDWCPTYSSHVHNATPVEFSSTAFHLIDLQIMSKVAAELGQDEDLKWFEERRDAVAKAMVRKFFSPIKCSFGSETADAMALELGIFPDGRALEGANGIKWSVDHSKQHFIDMGIFGLSRFASQMSRNGAAKGAYEIFAKNGEDSFGVMVDSLQVTTLWECLPMSMSNFRAPHGSHCHPMQSGYDQWMYEDIAGIRPCEKSPGFKTVVFKPELISLLEWAKASVDTRYGKVSSSWKNEGASLVWNIEIPAGSKGLVALPQGKTILVNGKEPDFPTTVIGADTFAEFPSGSFDIVIRNYSD